MRNDRLTERQWWQKAKRHEKWLAAMGDELEAIGTVIERPDNAKALQKSAARAQAISKRIVRLQRVMQRHFERAPRMLADIRTGQLVMLSH
jgi:hypothetical protein